MTTNTNNIERIVTHSGPFHADDIFAIAMLENAAMAPIQILRSRDKNILEAGKMDPHTLLVDVGGEYNPEQGLLDHHFVGSPQEDGVPLASAGMVLRYLGYPTDGWLGEVIRNVDATDNGVKVPGWSLSLTLHKCNPVADSNFDERFDELTIIVGLCLRASSSKEELVEMIETHYQVKQWVREHDEAQRDSKRRVRQAMKDAEDLLILNQFEPALINVAHEAGSRTLFSIYPSPTDGFMIQQIPVEPNSFAGRLQLPKEWAGKRDEELSELTGIAGCIFVHPGRFIGGNKSLEGAVEMAKKAIELSR
jgi:uncharacterized UPF0160 family protein